MAHFLTGQEEHKNATEKGAGCAKAIAHYTKAIQVLESVKPLANGLGPSFSENFHKKLTEAYQNKDTVVNLNKSIYFEKELQLDQIPKVDPHNLVQLDSF